MIFTVERQFDYDKGNMLLASNSLQKCIDVVNNYEFFPDVADELCFSVWDNDTLISTSIINGHRQEEYWGVEHTGPVTYDEVMKYMVKNEKL